MAPRPWRHSGDNSDDDREIEAHIAITLLRGCIFDILGHSEVSTTITPLCKRDNFQRTSATKGFLLISKRGEGDLVTAYSRVRFLRNRTTATATIPSVRAASATIKRITNTTNAVSSVTRAA